MTLVMREHAIRTPLGDTYERAMLPFGLRPIRFSIPRAPSSHLRYVLQLPSRGESSFLTRPLWKNSKLTIEFVASHSP